MMRHLAPFLSVLFLFIGATGATGALAKCDKGEKKIRLGTWSDVDHQNRERAAKLLRAAVDKELQGKFCLQIISDPEKFQGTLAVTALQNGEVELAAPSFQTLASFSPLYGIFDLPFAFENIRAVERFQAATGSVFVDGVKKNALQPLAFWHGNFRQISAKRPVYRPVEIAGLKFRREDIPVFSEIIKVLYATSRTVPENDLTIALQKGEIDAQISNWTRLASDGSAKILDGVTETNQQFSGYQLMASNSWWTGLDKPARKSLIEIIGRISRQTNFDAINRSTSAKRSLMHSGIAVRTLTKKQRQEWKDVMQPIHDDAAYVNDTDIQTALQKANRGP